MDIIWTICEVVVRIFEVGGIALAVYCAKDITKDIDEVIEEIKAL